MTAAGAVLTPNVLGHGLSSAIAGAASWHRILYGVVLYSVFTHLLTALEVKMGNEYTMRSSGMPPPKVLDLRLRFSPEDAYHLFEGWGTRGIAWYLQLELLDLPYMITYTVTLAFLVSKLAGYGRQNLLPFVIMAFDLVQNIGTAYAAMAYPVRHDVALWVANYANMGKWLALCLVVFYTAGCGVARATAMALHAGKKPL